MPIFSTPSLILLLLSVAFWNGFRLISDRAASRTARRYVPVPGLVTGCWKDELEHPDDRPPGDEWVRFAYEWQGRRFEGDDCLDSPEEARRVETGGDCTLRVDPDRPERALLTDPNHPSPLSPLSSPLIFVYGVTWLLLLFLAGLFGFGP